MTTRESKAIPRLILKSTTTGYSLERDGQTLSFKRSAVQAIAKMIASKELLDELQELGWFKKKYCAVCGKEFYTHTSKVICCSDECQEERSKVLASQRRAKKRNDKTKTYHRPSLDNEIDEARKLGMTYGQYKAMKYIDEMEKIKVD